MAQPGGPTWEGMERSCRRAGGGRSLREGDTRSGGESRDSPLPLPPEGTTERAVCPLRPPCVCSQQCTTDGGHSLNLGCPQGPNHYWAQPGWLPAGSLPCGWGTEQQVSAGLGSGSGGLPGVPAPCRGRLHSLAQPSRLETRGAGSGHTSISHLQLLQDILDGVREEAGFGANLNV